MFIELTEFLRCPNPHPEVHLVLATGRMDGRDVVSGVVGCPGCQAEYRVEQGIARFGARPPCTPRAIDPSAADVQALLGIASPGGWIVLVGSAAALGVGLAQLIEGVSFVAVNAPEGARTTGAISLLEAPNGLPLRSRMGRGVVLGSECAGPPWDSEAARVVLPGLRVAALAEGLNVPGLDTVASGSGLWVGQRGTS